MTIEEIKVAVTTVISRYPVSKVVLFGSRANRTNRDDSDIDLLMEFSKPISLLTLALIKDELESLTGLDVDVIHGPLQETDLIKINKAVEIYAA